MTHHILRPRIEKQSILDELAKMQSSPASPIPPTPPTNPPVTSTTEFWTIPRVLYRGQAHEIELAKTLLENGETKTQEDWASHYQAAKSKGEFHSLDYPLFYGINKALKEQNAEEAKEFIKKEAKARWLMTLTRIRYTPAGLDEIIHNWGTRDKYESQVDFITPDEWIKNTSKPKSYQALLGTEDNIQEINSIFHWLNGTDAYAWKVNAKPDNPLERVARFDADSGRAIIYCSGNPDNHYASLGVRFVRAKK